MSRRSTASRSASRQSSRGAWRNLQRAPLHQLACVALLPCALSCGPDDASDGRGEGGAGGRGAGEAGAAGHGVGGSDAAPLRLAFESVPYETGLSYITDLEFLPDAPGELLAIDLAGGVEHARLTESGAEVLFSFAFDDVHAEYDAGQLAISLDPEFSENRFFDVATNLAADHVVVRRYRFEPGDAEAILASQTLILELKAPSAPRWHNISAMGFDEHGAMWALVGDKGLFEPAQDPADLLGSLIRILPSHDQTGGYSIPEDAALYAPDADPAIHSIGIRSPWKGLYREGVWYFGDVGHHDVEEVNVVTRAGQNFGWPEVEGRCADDVRMSNPDCSRYDEPWLTYGRSNSERYVQADADVIPSSKRSVYVGWIRRPGGPDPYRGRLDDLVLFGDAFVGFVRAQPIGAAEDESVHVGHLALPSAWDQGPDGYIYVLALGEEPDPKDPRGDAPSPLWRVVLED